MREPLLLKTIMGHGVLFASRRLRVIMMALVFIVTLKALIFSLYPAFTPAISAEPGSARVAISSHSSLSLKTSQE
ncbi:hypothetical protein [Woodsholea maritima]|uniref:hypothetical protein n=1 Tax=Woodsholea maritima TaxID=240237 RepID=UPI0003775E2B|nr:hypothetical protein [Woodsholea maritima]